ncbi:hypothetical protein FPV67DRAFT_646745 [Lyophyllum atratum]|nr:hypothetical protein FPV67DRAFT_646745 [Lyophyllum atratum]
MSNTTPSTTERLDGAARGDETTPSLPPAPSGQHTINAPIAESRIVMLVEPSSSIFPGTSPVPASSHPFATPSTPGMTSNSVIVIIVNSDDGDATDTDDGGYLNVDVGIDSDDGYDFYDMEPEYELEGYHDLEGEYDLEGGYEWDGGDDWDGGFDLDMDMGGCCPGCELNGFISRLQR